MKIRWGYGLAALVVFAIEVVIALYVRDAFVRPYLGEVLAVVLVYLGLRAISPLRVLPAAALTFAISVAIEVAQLLRLVDHLGLAGNSVASVVIGTHFDFKDILCYAVGVTAVVLIEALRRQRL